MVSPFGVASRVCCVFSNPLVQPCAVLVCPPPMPSLFAVHAYLVFVLGNRK